jgi:glycosyltransferase involved in cell wall biosynthesis
MRRMDFTLCSLVALGLAVVSLYPGTMTLVRDMMALEDSQFSRLIAICILSNLALWLLVFHLRVQQAVDRDRFDVLVRNMAREDFTRSYPDYLPLPKIVVLIPAYNEAENIGLVLKAMPRFIEDEPLLPIVIDDGSSDGTAEVVRGAGVPVVRGPLQRGGGAALRIGFQIATDLGAHVAVTMDADGQHLPEEIANLVKPIMADRCDFVIGSRILGKREKDSAVRLAGIHVFNALIRLLTSVRISDCSNGFRALRIDCLSRLHLRQDQYHTSELIIEAARRGVRIGEAPVTVKRRHSGESKKGRNWKYGFNFAKTILKTWWR